MLHIPLQSCLLMCSPHLHPLKFGLGDPIDVEQRFFFPHKLSTTVLTKTNHASSVSVGSDDTASVYSSHRRPVTPVLLRCFSNQL